LYQFPFILLSLLTANINFQFKRLGLCNLLLIIEVISSLFLAPRKKVTIALATQTVIVAHAVLLNYLWKRKNRCRVFILTYFGKCILLVIILQDSAALTRDHYEHLMINNYFYELLKILSVLNTTSSKARSVKADIK
jgi:hypothetical protein